MAVVSGIDFIIYLYINDLCDQIELALSALFRRFLAKYPYDFTDKLAIIHITKFLHDAAQNLGKEGQETREKGR